MQRKITWVTPEWREKMRQIALLKWGDTTERFWKKVEIKGPDECWPWTGCRDKRNYGYVRFRLQKRLQAAHRVAYFFTHGELPLLHICHKCDNPPCCNPKHLFPGTNQENIQDAVNKGRMCRGEKRPQSKLTERSVLEIRRIYSEGHVSQYKLAKQFRVGRSAIEKIVMRRTWAHI